MHLSTIGPLAAIRWGERAIYVMLFISFLVVFGQFDKIRTWLFLGAVLCLALPVLFSKDVNHSIQS